MTFKQIRTMIEVSSKLCISSSDKLRRTN